MDTAVYVSAPDLPYRNTSFWCHVEKCNVAHFWSHIAAKNASFDPTHKKQMGQIMSIFDSWMSPTERRILMLGLDAGGKSTILFRMKLAESVHTVPTIGFNVETVTYKNINFTIWDVGGQDKLRKLWRYYFHGNDCLIFVVDSNDVDRIAVARDELHKLLQEDELKDSPVLIWANKQDLPHSMTPARIFDELQLRSFKHRDFHVQGCQATTGAGLFEGLEWIKYAVEKRKI